MQASMQDKVAFSSNQCYTFPIKAKKRKKYKPS